MLLNIFQKRSEAQSASLKLMVFGLLCAANTICFAEQWSTYQNKSAGIEFKYPHSAKLSKQYENNYFASNKNWRFSPSGDNSHNGTEIVSISLLNLPRIPIHGEIGYYRSEVRIGMSQKPDEISSCATDYTSIQNINGNQFYISKSVNAAMTQDLDVTSYRTIYHNTCYAIEFFTAYRSGINKAEIEKHASIDEKEKRLLSSFKFIG